MEIRSLARPGDHGRWDAFVRGHPDGTFFHLAGWHDVIGEVFGHRTFFLYAEDAGTITGVLPLAHVRSRLFGNKLVSLPFCVYGGAVAADDASRAALLDRAGELARGLGVDYLELRNRQAAGALPASQRYVTFRRILDPDPEVNLKAVPRKQRAMVRKGAARGLAARQVPDVTDFYAVYAESLRNLGTPVLPLRYFQSLQRIFGDACEVTSVWLPDGRSPVASVMSFYFRDEVLPYYGGGTAAARDCHAYDFMYWELLVHALGRGSRLFDFGRSRQGSGSFRFKTHWGFEPDPLNYQYDLVRAEHLPNVTPDNPRFGLFIRAWQKLPLPLSKLLGPWLARDLG